MLHNRSYIPAPTKKAKQEKEVNSRDSSEVARDNHETESESENLVLQTGGFVAVAYTTPLELYIGKVVEAASEKPITISFLEKVKGGMGYKWPKKPTIEAIYEHQIFQRDLLPAMEGHIYKFDHDQLTEKFENCIEKLTQLERKTKIEAVWDDTEAPYRKVGRVCWKDFAA
ncbi:hypothetical protein AC249_AIPGENE26361 [Exaiptasia diaphana]|nr:hypothetical protein AC249_AIPGENE26361 [Exaiptasia diaphana]